MTPETEQPDPSRVSGQSGPPEPPKRQVPGIPVGPPRQDSDVDPEAHEALQMKVAMKMVGSAMVFIGFIQVFMSASTGAEISIFPMILYFCGPGPVGVFVRSDSRGPVRGDRFFPLLHRRLHQHRRSALLAQIRHLLGHHRHGGLLHVPEPDETLQPVVAGLTAFFS